MPTWLKSLLIIGGLVWIGVVYRPFIGSATEGGFLATDLAVLVDAAGGPEVSLLDTVPVPLQDMDASEYLAAGGPRGSILSGASLALSRRLWGVSESSAALYRLENLLLLLALGLGLGNFVRRVLMPWTGADHARAAARALPVVLIVQPFAVHAVAEVGARGELIYLALGAWAAATYMGARQDRKPMRLIAALGLFIGAHLAGGFSLALAILIGLGELGSVQRYQVLRRRELRGFLVFGGLAILATSELVLRWQLGSSLGLGGFFNQLNGDFFGLLGVLLLPVPVTGWPMVLAVVLLLASLHPALRAARHAPRLWGWMLGTWGVTLCASLAFAGPVAGVEIGLGDFTHAARMFLPVVVLTVGLVVVATGLQGFRRLLLPIGLVVGLGFLSLSQARGHGDAVDATGQLRADLAKAEAVAEQLRIRLASEGRGTSSGPGILVIDDGGRDVIDPFAGGIGHLLDASITGRAPQSATRRPVMLGREAFMAFCREEEFKAWRMGGVVLLIDGQLLALDGPSAGSMPPLWKGAASSPDLGLDPFNFGALSTRTTAEREGAEQTLPTQISFTNHQGDQLTGAGIWIASRGRTEALFDFSSNMDWLLAGQIGRAWFESGLARVESCEFLTGLGPVGGDSGTLDPSVQGDAWRFPVPAGAAELVPLEMPSTDEYRLVQLDLGSLELRSFEAQTGPSGQLSFAEAEADLETWSTGEVAWTLERRVDGCTIWRHRGRVVRPNTASNSHAK